MSEKQTESNPTSTTEAPRRGIGRGRGARISMGHRIKLIDWMREHKDDKRTYPEMAVQVSQDIGTYVSIGCFDNLWRHVNERRVRVRQAPATNAWQRAIEERLTACEKRCGLIL